MEGHNVVRNLIRPIFHHTCLYIVIPPQAHLHSLSLLVAPRGRSLPIFFSLTHSLTKSLTQSLTYSLTHSIIHPFIFSPITSLIHFLNHSLIHLFSCSLTKWAVHSCISCISCEPHTHAHTRFLIHSLSHLPCTYLFTHSFVHSHSFFFHLSTCSFTFSLTHLFTGFLLTQKVGGPLMYIMYDMSTTHTPTHTLTQ